MTLVQDYLPMYFYRICRPQPSCPKVRSEGQTQRIRSTGGGGEEAGEEGHQDHRQPQAVVSQQRCWLLG